MGGLGFSEASATFKGFPNNVALMAGARNLLEGCAGVQPGQRVLVLHEDPGLGWYDAAAPEAVALAARALGAEVIMAEVGAPGTPLSAAAQDALTTADIEIWFARIGDQDRFSARDPRRITVVSYARTAEELSSDFGTRPHAEMMALKIRIHTRLAAARRIRVTCPRGTDIEGAFNVEDAEDVTIRRFPMCMPRPVLAAGFSGRVALCGYLYPTGSRPYTPANLQLTGTIFAYIDRGRLVRFEGDANDTEAALAHHNHVGSLFGIDPGFIHSWHAGIHSGCTYQHPREQNPDRWANTVFGSPQWLHFHTCGAYAPGEISWMVEHPTVIADGDVLWDAGELLC